MKESKNIKGFKIPNDYFDEFETRLFNKINEEKFPKETGFIIPDGYFNNFEAKISNHLKNEQSKTKVISIISKRTFIYAASIAACAILIFSLTNKSQDSFSFDEIELVSIEEYINEGNIEVSEMDLSSLLTEDDLSNIKIEEDLIPENLIEDYLLENINDSSILIE